MIFYIGCCLGSFCDLVSYRLINNQNWIFERSYCESCNKQLKLIHTLPIISYLFLKGRCPYCHKKINRMHLFIEIISGISTCLLCFYTHHWLLKLMMMMILLIISLMDIRKMYFDGRLLMWLLGFSIINAIYHNTFIECICGLCCLSLPLMLFKKYIGEGDLWILAIMGISLKCKGIFVAFFIAVQLGVMYSIILVIFLKKKIKNPIPFCPFISIGVFFTFLLGL